MLEIAVAEDLKAVTLVSSATGVESRSCRNTSAQKSQYWIPNFSPAV